MRHGYVRRGIGSREGEGEAYGRLFSTRPIPVARLADGAAADGAAPGRRRAAREGMAIFALVAFLIAMVFGLSLYMMGGSSSTQTPSTIRLATMIPAEANLIRQRVGECVTLYGTWPTTATGKVKDMICPGAPSGQQILFNGAVGGYPPNPPPGFGDWTWSDDGTTSVAAISGPSSTDTVAGLSAPLHRGVFSATEAKCVSTGGIATFQVYLRYASPPVTSYPNCGTS